MSMSILPDWCNISLQLRGCSICLDRGPDIIKPCSCTTGTHRACLNEWITRYNRTKCGACTDDYNIPNRVSWFTLIASIIIIVENMMIWQIYRENVKKGDPHHSILAHLVIKLFNLIGVIDSETICMIHGVISTIILLGSILIGNDYDHNHNDNCNGIYSICSFTAMIMIIICLWIFLWVPLDLILKKLIY